MDEVRSVAADIGNVLTVIERTPQEADPAMVKRLTEWRSRLLDVAQSAATTPEEPPANTDSSAVGSLSLDVRTLREAFKAGFWWCSTGMNDSGEYHGGDLEQGFAAFAARLAVQEPRLKGWCSKHTFGSNVDPCPGCVKEAVQEPRGQEGETE
jgi:hypothetical protein